MVPQGDLDIPFISGLFNTMEWLGDYNKFYEKRCLSKPHVASNQQLRSTEILVTFASRGLAVMNCSLQGPGFSLLQVRGFPCAG